MKRTTIALLVLFGLSVAPALLPSSALAYTPNPDDPYPTDPRFPFGPRGPKINPQLIKLNPKFNPVLQGQPVQNLGLETLGEQLQIPSSSLNPNGLVQPNQGFQQPGLLR